MTAQKEKCELCEEERAALVMTNQVNGNKLNVCVSCHKEIWGGVK